METGIIIPSRGLPKTGQIVEYQAGDDGTTQGGWWLGRKIADNRERFITKTIDGDDVVIDLATGLMWAADGNEAGCNNGDINIWYNAIIYATGLDFAGYTDWRLPNVNELLSIVNWSKDNSSIDEPPFINTIYEFYWSSTTYVRVTTYALVVKFSDGSLRSEYKEELLYLRCVRGGL